MADPIELPKTTVTAPEADPNNVQAVKRFVFNETGNIMLATTDEKSDSIQQAVRDVFNEVSVFFAGMTKAISTTVDPNSPTGRFYSLYNYDALEAIIDGSGCFIHINEENVVYNINTFGADFSKDLIRALLGLATGTGELAFANALVSSVGKEGVSIQNEHRSSSSKVANIFFVCEYLLGMPIISAIVVTADSKMASDTFQAGPCIKTSIDNKKLEFHKDTYMFVTPTFIANYAGDLDKGMSDPAFLTLTSNFKNILTRTPFILNVSDTERIPKDAPETLVLGQRYRLEGDFFGDPQKEGIGTVELVDGEGAPAKTKDVVDKDGKAIKPCKKLKIGDLMWSDNIIDFSIGIDDADTKWDPAYGPAGPFTIKLTLPDNKTAIQVEKALTPTRRITLTAPRAFMIDHPN
jgi:hypothetical protein